MEIEAEPNRDRIVATMLDALHAEGIPFLLVGSFSSNHWGIPRSTRDADFVIELGGKSVLSLAQHLPTTMKIDPQVQFESVTGTLRNVIKVADTLFKVELFRLSQDPHDQERFRRRVVVPMLGRDVFLPTVEDVVITKLRWCGFLNRAKDREDIRQMLIVRKSAVDWDYVYHWCDQHGTRQTLDEIRREISSD